MVQVKHKKYKYKNKNIKKNPLKIRYWARYSTTSVKCCLLFLKDNFKILFIIFRGYLLVVAMGWACFVCSVLVQRCFYWSVWEAWFFRGFQKLKVYFCAWFSFPGYWLSCKQERNKYFHRKPNSDLPALWRNTKNRQRKHPSLAHKHLICKSDAREGLLLTS